MEVYEQLEKVLSDLKKRHESLTSFTCMPFRVQVFFCGRVCSTKFDINAKNGLWELSDSEKPKLTSMDCADLEVSKMMDVVEQVRMALTIYLDVSGKLACSPLERSDVV